MTVREVLGSILCLVGIHDWERSRPRVCRCESRRTCLRCWRVDHQVYPGAQWCRIR